MRSYVATIFVLILLFGSIAGVMYLRSAGSADSDYAPAPIVIAAATSTIETWDQYLDSVGTIKAVQGVELSSETSGQITALNFNSGDVVTKGELLLILNDTVEQASKQNQIASLELAKILHERDAKLITQKSIPQSQYDRSRANLQQAQAQLTETEARLSQKRITAPFNGTLGIRRVDIGDYVSPGTVIASLQNLTELEVDFTLPSQAGPLLAKGQTIAVSAAVYPEQQFKATLVAMDSRVDTSTRNIAVRAKLASGSKLLPGMFVTLRIALQREKQVVTVPETAVTYSLHGNTIFIIKPATAGNGLTQEPVIVDVGEVRDGRIAIYSGLAPGEQVVTAGQNKLFRGAHVAIDEGIEL
ncbi:MAG: efflux RND transporter periplasmic adaptor subunit [Oceanicoccus sp.]